MENLLVERTAEKWSLETGEKRPLIGCLQISYGVIVDILNLLLIRILAEETFSEISCFKIMLFLAVIDTLIIPINCILTGVLSIQGAVFCSYPLLIYISGSVALGLWCSSCCTGLLLVCNRLLTLAKPSLQSVLFNGNRTLASLLIPSLYGLYFLFIPPLLFNSKHGAWLFDPMIFPNRSEEYNQPAHTINNILTVALTCVLYIPFQSTVRAHLKQVHDMQSKYQRAKLQVLLQSTLICALNQTCAVLYAVINTVSVSLYVDMIGHFLWQFIHGAPVFIYLSLNPAIQKRFLEVIRLCSRKENAYRASEADVTLRKI